MRGAIATIALVASLCLATSAQQPIQRLDGSMISAAQVDATVTKLMKAAEVPGLGLAIINDGRVVYLKAYGYRDTATKQPLTPNSIFTAASLIKVAFGYLVMRLVDEKVLDLDKPIAQYLAKPLPEYDRYRDLAGDQRWKKITARMLLSHTAGFPNWRAFTHDRKLHIFFEPGTRFAYSGEGIDLLQMVVEEVTKKPLEQLMQDYVFQPLHMDQTSMMWQPRFEADFANGYDEYGRSLGPERRKRADAAGSMQTTTSDFAKFVQAVLACKGLSSHACAEMFRPQIAITSKHEFPSLENVSTDENRAIKLSYGLGWGLYWTPYGEAFFKEGHDEGWRNYTVCFPQKKSGIVIMTNSSNGEGIYKDLLEKLQRNTFTPIEWEGFTPYEKLPPRPPLKTHTVAHLDSKMLDRYAGQYTAEGMPGVLTVKRTGDHLSVQENDETPQELLAESEVDFFSTSSNDTCTFEVAGDGKVTGVVLHLDGRDVSIRKVK